MLPTHQHTSTTTTTTSNDARLTIAITGANGMVGQGVTEKALSDGHRVIALDMGPISLRSDSTIQSNQSPTSTTGNKKEEGDQYEYYQLDATDYEQYYKIVKEEGCTAIIHLAATFNKFGEDGELTSNVPSHVVYNKNSAMSWNTLEIAGDLGINRVVVASSVNSIGMIYSQRPQFDYLPLDENHPFYPEDAYSVSKHACEIQSTAFCRRYPTLRVASLRFHAVTPDHLCTVPILHARKGLWKDLWGWVSLTSTSQACLSALTVPENQFGIGHETFFVVAPTTMQQTPTIELLKDKFPELVKDFGGVVEGKGNHGLISTAKAKKMLGWEESISNRME